MRSKNHFNTLQMRLQSTSGINKTENDDQSDQIGSGQAPLIGEKMISDESPSCDSEGSRRLNTISDEKFSL